MAEEEKREGVRLDIIAMYPRKLPENMQEGVREEVEARLKAYGFSDIVMMVRKIGGEGSV